MQEIIRTGIVLIFIIIAYAVRIKPESAGAGKRVDFTI